MKLKVPPHIQEIKQANSFKNLPQWKKKDLDEQEIEIINILKTIIDPELGINIYDMGLIYDITINQKINIKMTFTTPFCPFANNILNQIEENINTFLDKDVEIEIVFEPKWNTYFMTENTRLEAGIY